jgi:hypothetical protein
MRIRSASLSTTSKLPLVLVVHRHRPRWHRYCFHEGTQVDKGQGTVRTFPLTAALPNLRTHNQTLKFAEEAENTGSDVFGVKGISVLYSIPRFDIVSDLNPEYMHCILLGVVRQFANLWFDAASHGKTFSLRKELSHIDNVLLKVKPPSEIKRLPRSLVTRCHWKASEWRSFLLFYSVVALKPVMPSQFYTHWLLLVYSVNTLMSKHVKRSDLLLCDLALHNFVILVPDLYGPEQVSYNVHLLQHIVKSVVQWGPLWASSALCLKMLTECYFAGFMVPLVFHVKFLSITLLRNICIHWLSDM